METWKQRERQEARSANGKYVKLNPCEKCGKSAGADYYSLPDCNETGEGVCLCKKCGIELMKDPKYNG